MCLLSRLVLVTQLSGTDRVPAVCCVLVWLHLFALMLVQVSIFVMWW